MPKHQPDERAIIAELLRDLDAVMEASGGTPGCQTVAAIMIAARRARRTGMPAPVAAAMLADYIMRGDPV